MAPTPDLSQQTVVLTVSLSRFWPARTAGLEAFTLPAKTDPRLLHFYKDILDSPEVRAVGHKDDEIRRYIASKSLPARRILRHGFGLVALEDVAEVDKRLLGLAAERQGLVKDAVAVYPTRKREAMRRLGPLASSDDYPSVDAFERAFSMTTAWVAFSAPATLAQVRQGAVRTIFEREQQKAERMWTDARTEIRDALREAWGRLVESFTAKLADETTARKRVRQTSLDALTRFVEEFETKMGRLTLDTELRTLLMQARSVLSGVDAKALRSDGALRERVRSAFQPIQAQTAEWVERAPAREIMFEE